MATFEQLTAANQTIAMIDVKGKPYAVVPERLKAFRMVYPDGQIKTEIVTYDAEEIVMRAEVRDGQGNLLGTGTAMEKQASSYINKTSYVENCETSAVGRALGMAGFGFDTSVAAAEEVANAMLNQTKKKIQPAPEELPVKPQESLAFVPYQNGDAAVAGKTLGKLWNEMDQGKNTIYLELRKAGDAETKSHIAKIDAYVAATRGGKA